MVVKKLALMAAAIIACGFITAQAATTLPDTLWVKVTLFDFRADPNQANRCPDFQMDWWNDSIVPNIVAPQLGADGLPVSNSDQTQCFFSQDVRKWFTPWQPGSTQIPVYKDQNVGDVEPKEGSRVPFAGNVDHMTTAANDRAYENMMYTDSLPFKLQNAVNGTYSFQDSSFFPLDGRGFNESFNVAEGSNPAPNHNFGFTMMLKRDFKYIRGQQFSFSGDDDVWVFINGKLALDIGGIHPEQTGNFTLSAANEATFGITEGNTYPMAFFFAERHTDASNCKITSNIITAFLDSVAITTTPSGTVSVGNTVTVKGIAYDDTGAARPDLAATTTWRIVDAGGNPLTVLQPGTSPDQVVIAPQKAWDTIWLEVTVQDGANSITKRTPIVVTPGQASTLSVEASNSPTGAGLQNPVPLDTVQINGSAITGKAYAVLRDSYGNFVSAANGASWSAVVNPGILTSAAAGSIPGEGVFTKAGPSGVAQVSATSGSMTDNVYVRVGDPSYTELRVVAVTASGSVPIDRLSIDAGADTVLRVEGYRTDLSRWETVTSGWNTTIGNISSLLDSQIVFAALGSGTGTISVIKTGATGFSLPVEVLRRGPVVVSGIYLDENGDGVIDKAELVVDSATGVLPTHITLSDPWGRAFTAEMDAGSYAWRNNDTLTRTIVVPVSGTFPFDATLGTDFATASRATVSGNSYGTGAIPVSDGVGPVLVSAVYTPGYIDQDGATHQATCVFGFSASLQPMDVGDNFTVTAGSDGDRYSFSVRRVVSQSGRTVTCEIDTGSFSGNVPANGDSIGYSTSASSAIRDSVGLAAVTGAQSRRVALEVKSPPYTSVFRVVGPFDPLEPFNPALVTKLTDIVTAGSSTYGSLTGSDLGGINSGTVTTIDLSTHVNPGSIIAADLRIEGAIYDAIGNVVVSLSGFQNDNPHFKARLGIKAGTGKTTILTLWDGKNENGRAVGGGMYLMRLKYNVGDGTEPQQVSSYLTVKRN